MNIKQAPGEGSGMKNKTTSDAAAGNITRTDLPLPGLVNSANVDDITAAFMSNFISDQEPVLRLAYLVLLSAATGLGNLLVLVAVLKFPSLRRPTNAMLGSLALSDFLVGTVTVPLYTAWTTRPGIFDRSAFMCALVLMSCLVVVTASQVSLLLLSVEQFLAVCHPFRHRNLLIGCPRLHTLGIVFAWASSFLTAAISLLAYEKTPSMSCNYYSVFDETFLFVASIFGVFFPFALIIYFNVRVLCVVKENEKKMSFAYRRDDNCPILRKKGRVERGSFSFSSSKTEGSLYDPTRRPSSFKGADSIAEISDNADRQDMYSVDGCVQRNMSKTKNSSRKYPTSSSDIKESKVNIATTAYKGEKFCPEARAEAPCVRKDSLLPVVVERDKLLPKSPMRTLLLCDGSVLSSKIKGKDAQDLAKEIDQPNTRQQASGFQVTRRWSLLEEMSCTAFSSSKPSVNPHYRHSVSAIDNDLFYRQCGINSSLSGTIPKELDINSSSNAVPSIPTLNDTRPYKKCFQIEKPFCTGYLSKFSNEHVSLLSTNKHRSEKHLTLLRHHNILNDISLTVCNSIVKSTPLLPKYIEFSDSLFHTGYDAKGQNCESLNHLPTLKTEHQFDFALNAKGLTDENKLQCPRSLSILDTANISYITKRTLASEKSYSDTISHVILPVKDLLHGDEKQRTIVTNLIECRENNQNVASVTNPDGQQAWNSSIQQTIKHHQTTDGLDSSSSFNVENCAEGLENVIDSKRGTMAGQGIFDKFAWSRKREDVDGSEAITASIDTNDAEISVDSGICVNNNIDILDGDHTHKESERDQFIIQTAKKASFDKDKYKENGSDGGVRDKSSVCLPLVSATESFRHLRLKRRLRSLSFSSVGVSQKVRWMVALVCATFILAWFPFFAVILANMFCDSCTLDYFLNAAIMVAFSKSMANPVVYALCHVEFRRAYGKVFKAIGLKSCC
ncbi:adenosine receptor A2a [Elysia marginata]|uniref:Adenosine receptor A2a n=1 Tax=Elysia marginata TaxID=1093978 RepID=A0AAV4EZ24_9GAST|nr:adenosine receptor A2a [Elysia marginata]